MRSVAPRDMGLGDGGVQIVRPGQFDMLGRNDEMLGDGDHVVAPAVGAFHHAGLVSSGDRRLPGLHGGLEAEHVRKRKDEFHA